MRGRDSGFEALPRVMTQGRTHSGNDASYRNETAWPPASTRARALQLGRGATGGTLSSRAPSDSAAYSDLVTGSEELAQRALGAEAQWLTYQTTPLASDTRIADSPVLDARITVNRDNGQLVPTLFDVDPAGKAVPISRGFLNLRYRDGLATERAMPVGRPVDVRVTFKNQDWTVKKGHRIALVMESSNSAWALPGEPGLRVEVASRRSVLTLPVAQP